jgi:hypothetical protein
MQLRMPNAWTGCAMLCGVIGIVAVGRERVAEELARRRAMRTVAGAGETEDGRDDIDSIRSRWLQQSRRAAH